MKHLSHLFFFVLFSCIASFAQAQNPNPNSALDQVILDEMNSERLPGVATIIVKGGEVVWFNNYGSADVVNQVPVTDETVFMLASISKVFTGTALMQLHEDGLIDLNEDINNHLPFPIEIPGYESDSITFRMLLTHTSSIIDGPAMDGYYDYPDPSISLADCIQRYLSTSGADYDVYDNFLDDAPGTVYEYSNMATALSGYLVEEISGMPFWQYCDQNIFDPLCMNNTGWFMSDFDSLQVARPHQYTGGQYVPYAHYGFADYPDGQLRTTIKDLSHFMLAYLQGGSFNNNTLLSSATINSMLTPQVASLEPGQGYNWYTEELWDGNNYVELWGHNGGESGVSTDMYIDRANDIGLAVLSNGEGSCLYICDELYEYALGLSTTGVGNPACDPVGVSEQLSSVGVTVFPNPTDAYVNFQIEGELASDAQLHIYSASGALVSTQRMPRGRQLSIDTSEWSTGIYFYRIFQGSGLPMESGHFIRR